MLQFYQLHEVLQRVVSEDIHEYLLFRVLFLERESLADIRTIVTSYTIDVLSSWVVLQDVSSIYYIVCVVKSVKSYKPKLCVIYIIIFCIVMCEHSCIYACTHVDLSLPSALYNLSYMFRANGVFMLF